MPPVSGITPWPTSGSMNRAPSAAMRMSQSNARWNEPPMAHPWMATMTGASSSNSCWIPRWPRRMSSWWDSAPAALPIDPTSRPEDHDRPSPRQTTARTSGRPRSSVSAGEELEVHVVVEGVVLVDVVVRDDGDAVGHVESYGAGHRGSVGGDGSDCGPGRAVCLLYIRGDRPGARCLTPSPTKAWPAPRQRIGVAQPHTNPPRYLVPNEDAFRHVAAGVRRRQPAVVRPRVRAEHPLGRADRLAPPGRRRHPDRRGRGRPGSRARSAT